MTVHENSLKNLRRGTLKQDKRCRYCHIPLMTDAERRIGIHVGCVAEAEQRFSRVSIKSPSYGRRKSYGGGIS